MTALHRYSTDTRDAAGPGPRWKSAAIPARPVAIMELFTGFNVVPNISGNVNRRPKPSLVDAAGFGHVPGRGGEVGDMGPRRSWTNPGRREGAPKTFLSYY
ncbi:hypothetical protein GCM10010206_16400 [Streptomyces cinerochromogenes]|nr:hypothetical protein GCM10010206_16400 [Streptomyces cinerochromogenes]